MANPGNASAYTGTAGRMVRGTHRSTISPSQIVQAQLPTRILDDCPALAHLIPVPLRQIRAIVITEYENPRRFRGLKTLRRFCTLFGLWLRRSLAQVRFGTLLRSPSCGRQASFQKPHQSGIYTRKWGARIFLFLRQKVRRDRRSRTPVSYVSSLYTSKRPYPLPAGQFIPLQPQARAWDSSSQFVEGH